VDGGSRTQQERSRKANVLKPKNGSTQQLSGHFLFDSALACPSVNELISQLSEPIQFFPDRIRKNRNPTQLTEKRQNYAQGRRVSKAPREISRSLPRQVPFKTITDERHHSHFNCRVRWENDLPKSSSCHSFHRIDKIKPTFCSFSLMCPCN
jgi:hypothetical protein